MGKFTLPKRQQEKERNKEKKKEQDAITQGRDEGLTGVWRIPFIYSLLKKVF